MHVRRKGPRAGQLQQECALQRRRESRAIKRASPRFFRCRYSAMGQQGNKAPLAARANSSSWNVRPSPRQKSHRASVPNKRTIASHRLMQPPPLLLPVYPQALFVRIAGCGIRHMQRTDGAPAVFSSASCCHA